MQEVLENLLELIDGAGESPGVIDGVAAGGAFAFQWPL